MNMDRHTDAHLQHFRNLVRGDGDGAAAHRRFYDEYMAVMDLTAEFYLQTIERVFQRRLLATGAYDHRGERIDPGAITDIAFLTIEGEKDDITGLGQTEAAHRLTDRPAGGQARPPHAEEGGALRGVQRLALARRDPAAHRRFHPRTRRPRAEPAERA